MYSTITSTFFSAHDQVLYPCLYIRYDYIPPAYHQLIHNELSTFNLSSWQVQSRIAFFKKSLIFTQLLYWLTVNLWNKINICTPKFYMSNNFSFAVVSHRSHFIDKGAYEILKIKNTATSFLFIIADIYWQPWQGIKFIYGSNRLSVTAIDIGWYGSFPYECRDHEAMYLIWAQVCGIDKY